jgi:hypothetical protein
MAKHELKTGTPVVSKGKLEVGTVPTGTYVAKRVQKRGSDPTKTEFVGSLPRFCTYLGT